LANAAGAKFEEPNRPGAQEGEGAAPAASAASGG
jgi:hypothetical protein